MDKSFSRRVVLGTALVLAGLIMAVSAYAAGLSGGYVASGRNPDGSAYSGTVQIVETGGTVAMTWVVGTSTYTGLGKVAGRVLEVDWSADAPVVYVINSDGTLYGTWAKGTALELLTPQ